jgi:hypothetical protein
MELNPVPILMSMVIYSNIGGTLTPVGDPPNVIIASNSYITKNGVNFTIFTMHMAIGVVMVMIQTYFQLRYKFRNINSLRFSEAQDVQELRHEIAVWQRAAASLSSYSKDEDLVRETLCKKVNRLNRNLKKKLVSGTVPIDSYKATLEELSAKVGYCQSNISCEPDFKLNFFFSVSNQKQDPVSQIRRCFGVCHHFLLLAFSPRTTTFIIRMDCIVGSYFIAYSSRSVSTGF